MGFSEIERNKMIKIRSDILDTGRMSVGNFTIICFETKSTFDAEWLTYIGDSLKKNETGKVLGK